MDDPGPALYLIIVILLVLSAFFSCAETAISTVNKLRLRKAADEGNHRAKTALRLSEHYDKTLFTILLGNNLVNIAMSSIATVAATALLGPSGALIATIVITVLVITFGEILPKSYGKDNSERMSLALAGPLSWISGLLTPFTWIFMRLKRLVSRAAESSAPTVTEDELIYMLGEVAEEGVIEEMERDLVQSALEFDEVTIREVLTPRVDVAALDIDSSPDEVRDFILSEGFSRIPVYEESVDNIIGVLITRDYLRALVAGEPAELRAMLAEPMFVHRTMKLSHLLAKLRANNTHLAVVTDDYGGTLGIVTMEDVLEELVGDIRDEGDDEVLPCMLRISRGCWEAQGSCAAEDLLDALGGDEDYDIPDGDYNTVNGWAGHIYGTIPTVGQTARYKDLELTVLEMEGHRIQYLRVERKHEEEAPCDGGAKGEEQA